MSERYSERRWGGVNEIGPGNGIPGPRLVAAEPSPSEAHMHALLARLLPDVDVALLVRALDAEMSDPSSSAAAPSVEQESALSPADRELRRVRLQLSRGEVARTLQHSLNNPLTALLAEAQLLEGQVVEGEYRLGVARIAELARRLAGIVRRLG